MGCACSDANHAELINVVKNDSKLNTKIWSIYSEWSVEGEPEEIQGIKTWPYSWEKLAGLMQSPEVGFTAKTVAAIKSETVDNPELPNINAKRITWSDFKNLWRSFIAEEKGKDKWEEVLGEQYDSLKTSVKLDMKKQGFLKTIEQRGIKKLVEDIWKVYKEWPVDGELTEKGGRMTWPLPFEAAEGASVSKTLRAAGWTEIDMAAIETAFETKDPLYRPSTLREDFKTSEVTWSDFQAVMRFNLSLLYGDEGAGDEGPWMDLPDYEWPEAADKHWPPLSKKVTLRNKIKDLEQVKECLMGEFRMYCKPDDGKCFSYGLVIDSVDIEAKTFTAKPRKEGRYTIQDGKFEWDEATGGRTRISYTEVWPPNNQLDAIAARLKSNGKFQCESKMGFTQKATRESNLPEDPEERMAKAGSKKYYEGDRDAVFDGGEGDETKGEAAAEAAPAEAAPDQV